MCDLDGMTLSSLLSCYSEDEVEVFTPGTTGAKKTGVLRACPSLKENRKSRRLFCGIGVNKNTGKGSN